MYTEENMAVTALKTEDRKIRVIPAYANDNNNLNPKQKHKLKVAAYARVSTDLEEQEKSYAAQVDYYKNYITKNEDWEFVEVYADEGISGLSTKKRDGFNRMIADALSGKINLILTKSISRFARNTVDTILTIRKLKEKDIEVIFEKENIKTLDPRCEMVLTIMSSLAQEESRSISQNCTWGQRKRFSDGKYSVAYSRFLGYDNDFKINEKEAEIVKLVYDLFINGKTYGEIRDELRARHIKTVTGKTVWEISVIKNLLKNEKYCGDALLQKCYTKDYITKKHVKNNGNVSQYYVEKGHEGIISKEIYELAQIEINKREKQKVRARDIFSGKLYCKECGGKYYKNTDRSDDLKKSWTVYKCDNKRNKGGCTLSHSIKIGVVKDKFVEELNSMLVEKPTLKELYKSQVIDLIDIEKVEIERDNLNKKIKEMEAMEKTEIRTKCIIKLKEELEITNKQIEINKNRLNKISNYSGKLNEFDEDLFVATVNKVIIDKDHNLEFVFNNE